jgi:hypothetical protein
MINSLDALALWFSSGFRLRIARDSLYNNRDQWSDLSIILQLLKINDGNRTNKSAINAIIIRMITKSTDRVAGGWFVNHGYDYGINSTT